MTYQRRWRIIAMALGLLAGCLGPIREFPVCGDGVKGGEEQCDGSDLGGATCASVLGAGYFLPPGKALSCKSDCTLDTSSCTNACILDAPDSLLDSCALQ